MASAVNKTVGEVFGAWNLIPLTDKLADAFRGFSACQDGSVRDVGFLPDCLGQCR